MVGNGNLTATATLKLMTGMVLFNYSFKSKQRRASKFGRKPNITFQTEKRNIHVVPDVLCAVSVVHSHIVGVDFEASTQ
jgi:hypothetical protein